MASASADAAVETVLTAWRRRTIDLFFAIIALLEAPVLIVCLLGRVVPLTRITCSGLAVAWILIVVAALLRRAPVRARIWLYCSAAYLTIGTLSLAQPRGSFAQISSVTAPVVLLVLADARFGRAAAFASITILLTSPFVRHMPAVAALFIHPGARAEPELKWIQIAGVVTILITQVVLVDRYHRFLLRTLAGKLIANVQLEREIEQRRDLEREVTAIADDERRRLGHDLHDGVCQQLTGAFLRCQALERRLARGESADSGDFGALSSQLADALDEARNVALGLCPLESDPGALADALRELAARVQSSSSVLCEFRASGNVDMPDLDAAQHLYRIAQEALQNAVRHARANRICVELHDSGDCLSLLVEDDGIGLSNPVPPRGMGLRTMANRARLLDGELAIGPAAGGGLRIACRVSRDRGAHAGQKQPEDRNGC